MVCLQYKFHLEERYPDTRTDKIHEHRKGHPDREPFDRDVHPDHYHRQAGNVSAGHWRSCYRCVYREVFR